MKGSPRISVRLEADSLERLQKYCTEAGCDVSYAVRRALEAFLGSQLNSSTNGGTPKRQSLPEDIVPLTSQYLAWARGDLRDERKRLSRELLAISFACKNLFPQTRGMLEGFQGLLQLCEFFGID